MTKLIAILGACAIVAGGTAYGLYSPTTPTGNTDTAAAVGKKTCCSAPVGNKTAPPCCANPCPACANGCDGCPDCAVDCSACCGLTGSVVAAGPVAVAPKAATKAAPCCATPCAACADGCDGCPLCATDCGACCGPTTAKK